MVNESILVSVEMVLFSLQGNQLYIYLQPYADDYSTGQWVLPHANKILLQDQTLEDVVHRNVSALDLGTLAYLEQVKTIGSNARDPRGWSLAVVYYGFIRRDSVKAKPQTGHWHALEHLDTLSFAHDHAMIMKDSLQRLQNKALYTSVPAFMLEEEFTLRDLQSAFEAILGFPIEKKSFRRRMQEAKLLKETNHVRHANHRPAQLFTLLHGDVHVFNRILEGVRS